MLWKISILLTTYMNHPSVEKVQNWPEFLTRPWGQDDWYGNLQTISPLGVCSATLKGLLFYFESCWTLFLNLPCYMSDRPYIRRGTWITLVYPEKTPCRTGLRGEVFRCLSVHQRSRQTAVRSLTARPQAFIDQPLVTETKPWTSSPFYGK